MRTPLNTLFIALLATLLAACSSQTAKEEEFGGFLSDYSNLTEQDASDGTRVLGYINPDIDTTKYTAIILEPVVLSPNSAITDQVSPERLQQVLESMDDKLEFAIRDVTTITTRRGPGVARIRWAISSINAVKRDPRWFEYTPVTFATSQIADAAGARDDVVELFLEAEMTDSITGELLSHAVRKGQTGKGVGQGDPIGPDDVDEVLQQWADSMALYLKRMKQGL